MTGYRYNKSKRDQILNLLPGLTTSTVEEIAESAARMVRERNGTRWYNDTDPPYPVEETPLQEAADEEFARGSDLKYIHGRLDDALAANQKLMSWVEEIAAQVQQVARTEAERCARLEEQFGTLRESSASWHGGFSAELDELQRRFESSGKTLEDTSGLARNLSKMVDDLGRYIDRDASYLRRHGETLTAHVERFVRLEGDMNEVKGRIDEVMRAVQSHNEGASGVAVAYLQTFDGIAKELEELRTRLADLEDADNTGETDEEIVEALDTMVLAKQIDTLRMDMGNLFTLVERLSGDTRDEREIVGSAEDPDLEPYYEINGDGKPAGHIATNDSGVGYKLGVEQAIDFDQAREIQKAAYFQPLVNEPPTTLVEFGGTLPSGDEVTVTLRVKRHE